MIKIKRSAPPEWLTAKDKPWHKETEKAIAHYESGETSAFDFKMYSDSRLKDELKTIFTKCAYCESTYGAVFDGDVEHFRPKGRVSEKNPKNPGYYWLANDWDNLLLACQHCNQRRQHILYGEESLAGYGKLDQFPLKDESKRATRGPLDAEEKVRLLINPLFKQMLRVKRELERLNNDPSDAQEQEFARELDDLMEYGKDTALYAGMCRYFLKEFLKENGLD